MWVRMACPTVCTSRFSLRVLFLRARKGTFLLRPSGTSEELWKFSASIFQRLEAMFAMFQYVSMLRALRALLEDLISFLTTLLRSPEVTPTDTFRALRKILRPPEARRQGPGLCGKKEACCFPSCFCLRTRSRGCHVCFLCRCAAIFMVAPRSLA